MPFSFARRLEAGEDRSRLFAEDHSPVRDPLHFGHDGARTFARFQPVDPERIREHAAGDRGRLLCRWRVDVNHGRNRANPHLRGAADRLLVAAGLRTGSRSWRRRARAGCQRCPGRRRIRSRHISRWHTLHLGPIGHDLHGHGPIGRVCRTHPAHPVVAMAKVRFARGAGRRLPGRRMDLGRMAFISNDQAHLDELDGAVGGRLELLVARGVLFADRYSWLAPLGFSVHRDWHECHHDLRRLLVRPISGDQRDAPRWTGKSSRAAENLLIQFGSVLLAWLVLYHLYRQRIFLRI